ncbi:MAG: RNA polymerase factor sigma-54 [Eubacteriales bacterium]|nr:RNA polymerase factor sigma-54 [Eubacteriales bacterium]
MSSDMYNGLSITQTHRLQLNPQLLQSISVLCMNTTELGSYVEKLYQENPCIERREPVISDEMLKVLKEYRSRDYQSSAVGGGKKTAGTVNTGSGAKANDEDESPRNELSSRYVDDYIDSLSYDLKQQIESAGLDKSLEAVCLYLTDMLEDNGWLTEESIDSLKQVGVPEELLDTAVAKIKTLEPAGVGAKDLAEYIRLQLERNYPDELIALALCDKENLELCAKHNYNKLAEKLGTDIDSVKAAAELISSLNSSISATYSKTEETVYVYPDIYIYIDEDGKAKADTNEYDIPVVGVSEKYLELYKTTDDKELKAYLKDKINEAYKLIGNIGRRKSTLQRLFDYVIKEQEEYFGGLRYSLKPMTMTDAAEALDVNVSTISRCLMHKYVQCPQGMMPAKYFFSRSVPCGGSEDLSQQGAVNMIARLVENEDRHKPLSDAKLCERLNDEGYAVARRTVAKYRGMIGIPDYRVRRDRYIRILSGSGK